MHTIEISEAGRLADQLRQQRIPLKMSCGGHGSCKTCRVVLDGEPVLACQTEVTPGSYDLNVPSSAASTELIQIDLSLEAEDLEAYRPRWQVHSVTVPGAEKQPYASNRARLEPALPSGLRLAPDFFDGLEAGAIEGTLELACFDGVARFPVRATGRRGYVFAVDIGTTTLAAALIDVTAGRLVDCRGALNQQYNYAEDLVARIAFCHTPELLAEMQELVLKRSLLPLLKRMLKDAEVPSAQVLTTVLSGNAPMIHLLLGLDPSGMGGWPFNGVDYHPAPRAAATLRLPGERLEFIPAASAYLGGDIVSGLAQIDFAKAPEGTLFIDLGTNAEMALKAGGRLLCTAVPAGPSFEGGGFPCGVSAIPGAIDHVWEEDGMLHYRTLGDKEAVGLCGSGIISFVAAAFRARVLRKKGRFARRHEKVEMRELLGETQRVYPLTDDVYLSEDDISNFLQAKAAVFSGLITLCRVAGIELSELHAIHLAGNFGKRVRVDDLIDIGLLPPLPEGRISACGNTSLKGAIRAALDQAAVDRRKALLERLEFIELNAEPTFQDDFINALFIPHLKLSFSREPEALTDPTPVQPA